MYIYISISMSIHIRVCTFILWNAEIDYARTRYHARCISQSILRFLTVVGQPHRPQTWHALDINVTITHPGIYIYIYIRVYIYIYILIIILFLIFIKNNEWCSWFSWKIRGFMINMKNNDFHDFHIYIYIYIYIYPYLWAYIIERTTSKVISSCCLGTKGVPYAVQLDSLSRARQSRAYLWAYIYVYAHLCSETQK